jgi:predicted DNA-binding protein (UPF0251 family)
MSESRVPQDRQADGRFAGRILSDEEVERIRLLADSGLSHGKLAKQFHADRSTITRIVQRSRRGRASGDQPAPR